MEANYVHKDSTTLIQDKLVKNELNQIELQYNALKQQKFNELLKENQKLKEKLDKYENPEDMTLMMMWCTEQVKDENKKLKKQLEDAITSYTEEHNLRHNSDLKLDVLENQQKEFIEYMTKTIEELECDDVDDEEMKGYLIQRIDTFKEILQKYKEIIGENNNKLLRKSE